MSPRVNLSFDGSVAELRFVRPEAGNAIDPVWVAEFRDAVATCAESAEVRAVLITADGRAFTVGGDLKHFSGRLTDLDVALEEMVPVYHEALAQLARLTAPVVAAIQGPVAGGGLGVAFCSDIVLAAPEARFVCGFSKLGLSGDGGGSWWLPRLVGPKRAAAMMFENRELSADEAVELGIVTRVVAADRLEPEARAVAQRLADGPAVAFANMRRLLRESPGATLEQQLAAERTAMADCGRTADAREGVSAFVARPEPKFGPPDAG
jgi:2-(1,2-epoxy-1,2-dihydrophenyl)acetyl-CoA isomerase